MRLNVTIHAPEQESWTGQAEKVVLTSSTGQIGILPGHTSMVTTVCPGLILIEKSENEWLPMISFCGVASVNNDFVEIILTSYEPTLEISEELADEQLKIALNELEESKDDPTANKILLSQQTKTAAARLFGIQILTKKRLPFN